jgi:site-specific recombinase XerD
MQAIESCHPLKGSMMASARDLFVFQMHTGLAYADTQAFDFSQYYQVDGRWCTVGHRVKNGQEYVIQLSEECERILKQYGWKLPKLANSDYNKCLKALGAAVGIDKRIHSHLARHSFGTKMAASDVAIQNVKKMMGHKNIQQTLRYAKALPESVFAEFRKVEEKDKTRKKGVGK